tara:strand:- start:814 stop:1008 length:195 start_codon:yes stop_codon:yes gene_type:complete
MYVTDKNYQVGLSLTAATPKVLTIDVAKDDDEKPVGVWIKATHGSIYLPKELLAECQSLLQEKE